MNTWETLLTLMGTRDVIIPLFLISLTGSAVIIGFILAIRQYWTSSHSDTKTAEQRDLDEAFEQQRRLTTFHTTGRLPKKRMQTLARGTNGATKDVFDYRELGATYDFVIETDHEGNLIALDMRFREMPDDKRIHRLDPSLRFATAEEWHRRLKRVRFNALRRAQSAGLVPVGPSRRRQGAAI